MPTTSVNSDTLLSTPATTARPTLLITTNGIKTSKSSVMVQDQERASALMEPEKFSQISEGGSSKEWNDCAKSRNCGGNTTERVPVASSEHVAEIVGRQGSKIKALRAKTNTYIKTPVRGEEPVFVVTGRADDVIAAKMEILSVAEHFDHVMALNKARPLPVPPSEADGNGCGDQGSSANHVTVRVRVPYRVVGLLVGPKGATIKRIQLDSQTYIVTPSRDKEPIFEITGTPENVERAKAEIEGYIALRTGISDLTPLQQQQQQQMPHTAQASPFYLPPLSYSDISALVSNHALTNGNSLNNLQLLGNVNGSTVTVGDIYNSAGLTPLSSPANSQLMTAATVALLNNQTQNFLKSPALQSKGAFWNESRIEPKPWPGNLAEVLGSNITPWLSISTGNSQSTVTRQLTENGSRKMSLSSSRETPICLPKSYQDDIFDPAVINQSILLGYDAVNNHNLNGINDFFNYDKFNTLAAAALAAATTGGNEKNCQNNFNRSNNNHTSSVANGLGVLVGNNISANKNFANIDPKFLATFLSLRQNSNAATSSNLLLSQQHQLGVPGYTCDSSLADLNNNIGNNGLFDYSKNSLLLSNMLMSQNSNNNIKNNCNQNRSREDKLSDSSFSNTSNFSNCNYTTNLNILPNSISTSSNTTDTRQNPYLALSAEGEPSLSQFALGVDRTFEEGFRYPGVDTNNIMAFSDLSSSSNSNSSSSSSPTDVIERNGFC